MSSPDSYQSQEKKGRVKVTVEVEINEPFMEIIKESMANMPAIIEMMAKRRKKE